MAARNLPSEWQEAASFVDRHLYPAGAGPKDVHPKAFGKLERHWYGRHGDLVVAVHSTERRKDGWSYNVAIERDRPEWLGWFHHVTGRRIRHASSADPAGLAGLLGVT